MKLDTAYVNEQLIHVLLFTPYNLVIKDFSNLEKFKTLFSIVEGYHFEQINLSEYEDMETIEKVLDNLSSIHEKVIIAFSKPKTEFLHDILGAKSYRFVLLVGNSKPVIEWLNEYTGNNLLTYSIKNKEFLPTYDFSDLEYSNFILETVKGDGVRIARDQVRALFNFTKTLYQLYNSGRDTDCKEYLLQMGSEQLKKNVPQIERLFKVYYDRDISISDAGKISEKNTDNKESEMNYIPQQYATIEEEFGIVEPTAPATPVTSKTIQKIKSPPLSGITVQDADDYILQEKLDDVKKDLQERVDTARKEYMSVMRRVDGEFTKTLNHAIREHGEKNPTVIENPTKAIEMYCELRCKSWYKSIPEEVLSEMLLYHVKNLMKVQKISLDHTSFPTFLEAEQDKFLEAIVELPHESLHLQKFIDTFTQTESVEEIIQEAEIEEEIETENVSGPEYIKQCITASHISDLTLYEIAVLEIIRNKGKG